MYSKEYTYVNRPPDRHAHISERIAWLRQKLDVNQSELARRVGVGRAAVNAWEQGKKVPEAGNVALLARELESSAEYILGMTNDPTPEPVDPTRAKVDRLAARFGLSTEVVWGIAKEFIEDAPSEVYDVMSHLRSARLALRKAEYKMGNIFGTADPEIHYMDDHEEHEKTFDLDEELRFRGFRRTDFRPHFTDETIRKALEIVQHDPAGMDLLRSMTIPMEHRPGVSRGKAARHDLKGKDEP